MSSCHERNNAASQLCYYIACVIVICVVSAIMSRAKYALNTRYARKQNLKLRCTYLRCIFVLDFCRTIVFGHFCLPQSCLLPDHCFWSLVSAAKLSFAGPLFLVTIFCHKVLFPDRCFWSPFSIVIFWPQSRRNWSRTQNVSKLSLLKKLDTCLTRILTPG